MSLKRIVLSVLFLAFAMFLNGEQKAEARSKIQVAPTVYRSGHSYSPYRSVGYGHYYGNYGYYNSRRFYGGLGYGRYGIYGSPIYRGSYYRFGTNYGGYYNYRPYYSSYRYRPFYSNYYGYRYPYSYRSAYYYRPYASYTVNSSRYYGTGYYANYGLGYYAPRYGSYGYNCFYRRPYRVTVYRAAYVAPAAEPCCTVPVVRQSCCYGYASASLDCCKPDCECDE